MGPATAPTILWKESTWSVLDATALETTPSRKLSTVTLEVSPVQAMNDTSDVFQALAATKSVFSEHITNICLYCFVIIFEKN